MDAAANTMSSTGSAAGAVSTGSSEGEGFSAGSEAGAVDALSAGVGAADSAGDADSAGTVDSAGAAGVGAGLFAQPKSRQSARQRIRIRAMVFFIGFSSIQIVFRLP